MKVYLFIQNSFDKKNENKRRNQHIKFHDVIDIEYMLLKSSMKHIVFRFDQSIFKFRTKMNIQFRRKMNDYTIEKHLKKTIDDAFEKSCYDFRNKYNVYILMKKVKHV